MTAVLSATDRLVFFVLIGECSQLIKKEGMVNNRERNCLIFPRARLGLFMVELEKRFIGGQAPQDLTLTNEDACIYREFFSTPLTDVLVTYVQKSNKCVHAKSCSLGNLESVLLLHHLRRADT